jgi:benzoate-CoA ligase
MSETVAAPPERFNFAQHLIAENAARAAKLAYIDDRGTLTYGALADRVRLSAAALLAMGVQPEQRVLLLMEDCNEWPVTFLGALYAGVVPVCVNTLLTPDDYAYMLANSNAQAAIVSGGLLPTLQAAMDKGPHGLQSMVVTRPAGALPEGAHEFEAWLAARAPRAKPADTAADDIAFWLYSSGSTGRPKGTVHVQGSLYWTAELYAKQVLGLTEADVTFSAAKLFFAYGLGNALTFPLSVGATAVLMAGRPTPDACFERLKTHQPTVYFGAPTGYAGMLASPSLPTRDEVALRMCSSAGEALPREIGERFTARFGAPIIDGLGSTEMLHIFISNRPGDVRYGSSGKPVAGYEVELRDESGQVITAHDQVGDLFIKGPTAALMYWANRAKSRDTFQGAWTKSGDKYYRDADGYYVYAGRNDDMLKVSGQYVSPFEVESTLMQHTSVLEAAVIGVIDDNGLTRAKAFVVLKAPEQASEALSDALKEFVKSKLAPVKYPRQIEFVRELPKTATGKIQRFRLREAEQRARP